MKDNLPLRRKMSRALRRIRRCWIKMAIQPRDSVIWRPIIPNSFWLQRGCATPNDRFDVRRKALTAVMCSLSSQIYSPSASKYLSLRHRHRLNHQPIYSSVWFHPLLSFPLRLHIMTGGSGSHYPARTRRSRRPRPVGSGVQHLSPFHFQHLT